MRIGVEQAATVVDIVINYFLKFADLLGFDCFLYRADQAWSPQPLFKAADGRTGQDSKVSSELYFDVHLAKDAAVGHTGRLSIEA